MEPDRANKVYRGQGLVEYSLVLMLISVVVIAGLRLMGPSILRLYELANAMIP